MIATVAPPSNDATPQPRRGAARRGDLYGHRDERRGGRDVRVPGRHLADPAATLSRLLDLNLRLTAGTAPDVTIKAIPVSVREPLPADGD